MKLNLSTTNKFHSNIQKKLTPNQKRLFQISLRNDFNEFWLSEINGDLILISPFEQMDFYRIVYRLKFFQNDTIMIVQLRPDLNGGTISFVVLVVQIQCNYSIAETGKCQEK